MALDLILCRFRGAPKGEGRWQCTTMHWHTLPPQGVTAEQCNACPIARMFGGSSAPAPPPPPEYGPGTELKKLLAELGLEPSSDCQCNARAAQMNAWGPAGCREHREEIIEWLKDEAWKASWTRKLAAGVKAFLKGLAVFNLPSDLLDEAMHRAESAAPPAAPGEQADRQEQKGNAQS